MKRALVDGNTKGNLEKRMMSVKYSITYENKRIGQPDL